MSVGKTSIKQFLKFLTPYKLTKKLNYESSLENICKANRYLAKKETRWKKIGYLSGFFYEYVKGSFTVTQFSFFR